MNSQIKDLYIITGKGGVGKTNAAFALVKHLNDQGQKCSLSYFQI
jgi:anion-transporting  ArsA/GET3 family ATPase